MLICILFVASICHNEAHEEVGEIAEEAMDELEKLKEKYDADPISC
jgi:hypothetical protein